MVDELRFDGKVAIVTGGGRGFGRSHARELARRGASVVVADYGMEVDGIGWSEEPARSVVQEIRDAGGEATAVLANCAVETEAQRVVQTAIDAYGKLDVLVNNAGISDPDWLADQTSERLIRMVDNQFFTTLWMTKAAWPHLEASGGNVVCTASEATTGNVPKAPAYSGAKGGVLSLSKALALDGRRLGIRVNAISPRGKTRMVTPERMALHYDQPPETFEHSFDTMPTEYASAAVIFFAHESCEVTGETFVCGGGTVLRLALIETHGIVNESGGVSPEEIAARLDEVLDSTDAKVMTIDTY
ncbi:MAG TPA: SDR family NAD(P)-dependent oxidoreductase [Acidimicrobiales bacterium]